MLRHIEEHGKCVEITGFRDVTIDNAEEFVKSMRNPKRRNITVQFFNAELIATWQHLYFAVLDALLAFRNEWNVSKDVAMEVMLYVSAQRQIRKAIELVGVKRGCANVAMVIVGENQTEVKRTLSALSERLGKQPVETVLEFSRGKSSGVRRAFGIAEAETATISEKNPDKALVNLVIERMALLATQL